MSDKPPMPLAAPLKKVSWLDCSESTRSPRLNPSHPVFQPFHDLEVEMIGMDLLREKFHAGTPCSPTHLIWIVASGRVSVDFGEGPVILEKGRMAMCPALHPHWVKLLSKSACGIWVHFRRGEKWRHLSEGASLTRKSRHVSEIRSAIEGCIRECASDAFGAERNALHYAKILAVLIERELLEAKPGKKSSPALARFEQVCAGIIARPGETWTVAKLARLAGTSSRELHRLCADHYGVGPMGLVARIRMDRAMEILSASDLKIEAVAREVGYGTAHAFSAAFFSHVGKRPGAFRRSGRTTESPSVIVETSRPNRGQTN